MDDTAEPTGKKQKKVMPPGQRWLKGQSGNPAGRPKGTRNQLSTDFIADCYQSWLKGGLEAIEKVRIENPGLYCQIIGKLVPKEYQVTPESAEGFAKVFEALGQASKRVE